MNCIKYYLFLGMLLCCITTLQAQDVSLFIQKGQQYSRTKVIKAKDNIYLQVKRKTTLYLSINSRESHPLKAEKGKGGYTLVRLDTTKSYTTAFAEACYRDYLEHDGWIQSLELSNGKASIPFQLDCREDQGIYRSLLESGEQIVLSKDLVEKQRDFIQARKDSLNSYQSWLAKRVEYQEHVQEFTQNWKAFLAKIKQAAHWDKLKDIDLAIQEQIQGEKADAQSVQRLYAQRLEQAKAIKQEESTYSTIHLRTITQLAKQKAMLERALEAHQIKRQKVGKLSQQINLLRQRIAELNTK